MSEQQSKREFNYEILGRLEGILEFADPTNLDVSQRLEELFNLLHNSFVVWVMSSEDAFPSQREFLIKVARIVNAEQR